MMSSKGYLYDNGKEIISREELELLPAVSEEDVGKVLTVDPEGGWEAKRDESNLFIHLTPTWTSGELTNMDMKFTVGLSGTPLEMSELIELSNQSKVFATDVNTGKVYEVLITKYSGWGNISIPYLETIIPVDDLEEGNYIKYICTVDSNWADNVNHSNVADSTKVYPVNNNLPTDGGRRVKVARWYKEHLEPIEVYFPAVYPIHLVITESSGTYTAYFADIPSNEKLAAVRLGDLSTDYNAICLSTFDDKVYRVRSYSYNDSYYVHIQISKFDPSTGVITLLDKEYTATSDQTDFDITSDIKTYVLTPST